VPIVSTSELAASMVAAFTQSKGRNLTLDRRKRTGISTGAWHGQSM
jgi:hypothetical protein